MNNIIEYKGYQAVIEYSAEDATLFGKVLDVEDRIIFEIDNPSEANSLFKEVIDDYIEFCKANNKEPCKPFKGVFNVRISPELHKRAVQISRNQKQTLNSFVENAIRHQVEKKSQPHVVNIYLNNNSEHTNYSKKFSQSNTSPSPRQTSNISYSKPNIYVN